MGGAHQEYLVLHLQDSEKVSFLIPALSTVTGNTSQSHNVCMYSRDLIATIFI